MSKKKTETTQTQTQSQNQAFNNTINYGEYTPSNTEDLEAFRNWRPQMDPGIAAQYGAERSRLDQSFNNPLGGYYSPRVLDAVKRSAGRDIGQRESQAFRQGAYDVNQQRSGQLGSLAALTMPRLIQTGSSGTANSTGTSSGKSTTVEGNNLFGDIMQIGMGAAQMAVM